MLEQELIREIFAAVVSADMDRGALLGALDRALVASIPVASSPAAQILTDLQELDRMGTLPDGSIPLRVCLETGIALLGPRREAEVFRRGVRAISPEHLASEPPATRRLIA